jgi:hypothetical protein
LLIIHDVKRGSKLENVWHRHIRVFLQFASTAH